MYCYRTITMIHMYLKMEEKDFAQIQKEFDDYQTILTWSSSDPILWKAYNESYSLKTKALAELKSLYQEIGEKQFLKLASISILEDPYNCDPVDLVNDTSLEKQYYIELAEFNKKFLSKVLNQLTPDKTADVIKYLSNSIGTGIISKGFVDAIRLNPESPLFSKEYIEAYRESLKDGDWSTDKRLEQDKLESEIEEKLIFADSEALNNNYTKAIDLYRNVLILISMLDNSKHKYKHKSIISKIIICWLSEGDLIEAQRNLERFTDKESDLFNVEFSESEQPLHLKELLDTMMSYDLIEFTNVIKKYYNNSDSWLITMLLKCKNNIMV